jgi:hypothetical protein
MVCGELTAKASQKSIRGLVRVWVEIIEVKGMVWAQARDFLEDCSFKSLAVASVVYQSFARS